MREINTVLLEGLRHQEREHDSDGKVLISSIQNLAS